MTIPRPWWRLPLGYLLKFRPRQKYLRDTWIHRLLGTRLFEPTLWIPERLPVAKGMAIGAFVGLLTFLIGFHIPLVILLCYAARANVAGGIAATFISNPVTLAGILWMEVKLGQWLAPGLTLHVVRHPGLAGYFTAAYGKTLLVGSLAAAPVAGLLAYPFALWMWEAVERIVRRRRRGASRRTPAPSV